MLIRMTQNKEKNFLRFNEQIVNSKHFFSFNRLSEFKDYDYYFVGSDQIWNPQYGGLSDLDLLTFTQKKKIAISASFGIEKLPSSCETKVKQCLSTFDAISVREEAAKRIVEENTGRTDVEVLIDPTMMLCPEDWDRVIKKPKDLTNKRYVVCYFLGTLMSIGLRFHSWQKGKSVQLLTFRTQKVHITVAGHRSLCI